MKLKKIFAAIATTAVAATMAVSASALSFPYTATLGFADGVWAAQDWETATEVTGNGTYELTAKFVALGEDEETGDEFEYTPDVNGVTVFVIDIAQLGTDLGCDPEVEGGYDMSKCTISDIKVTCGSTEVTVDNSKVLWGDPEGKGNLRIEIYNAYGATTAKQKYDESISPINPNDVYCNAENGDLLKVSFTIAGLPEDAPAEPETPDEPTDEPAPAPSNPGTGVEGIAVAAGVAALATGAVIVSKKRK